MWYPALPFIHADRADSDHAYSGGGKRSKTDQLILTAPVSVGGIVMGKFLALLTIFAIPVAIICFYPLIMAQYGSVPMGEAYLSILAYFLLG